MAATEKPLDLPTGNPAQLGPITAPLYPGVFDRLSGQKAKRRHASSTRKVAFATKTRAFPGKVTI